MSRLSFAIILLIPATNFARASEDPPQNEQRPIALTANSSKVLPMPSFSAESGPQCDSSGNLYFRTGFRARESVVLKLAASDGSATVYRPTDATIAGAYFVAFHVTAERKIALLVSGRKKEPYVYEFNGNDPVNASHTTLDAPEGLNALTVQSFVVLPNDHMLLQGYFDEKAPKDKRGHGYTAEFAPSGKLLRISLDKVSDDVLKSVADRGAKTAVAQGQDGLTYLLEADRVVVLSPAGNVEREMKLTAPEPGYGPDLLYMHGRQLVVGFSHSEGPGKSVKTVYAMLDPSSGEVIRLYEPSPELGNNLVCFSDEGLTFMTVENRHVKLINAAVK